MPGIRVARAPRVLLRRSLALGEKNLFTSRNCCFSIAQNLKIFIDDARLRTGRAWYPAAEPTERRYGEHKVGLQTPWVPRSDGDDGVSPSRRFIPACDTEIGPLFLCGMLFALARTTIFPGGAGAGFHTEVPMGGWFDPLCCCVLRFTSGDRAPSHVSSETHTPGAKPTLRLAGSDTQWWPRARTATGAVAVAVAGPGGHTAGRVAISIDAEGLYWPDGVAQISAPRGCRRGDWPGADTGLHACSAWRRPRAD